MKGQSLEVLDVDKWLVKFEFPSFLENSMILLPVFLNSSGFHMKLIYESWAQQKDPPSS